jgi:hypothetical protein
MYRTPLFVLGIVVCILAGESANALPRFAALTGQKCISCHINPSGGAMRQTLGAQYGREELPVPAWSPGFQIEDFTTALTNFLGVGADFRTLFYTRQKADSAGSRTDNAFWQMQGDLYLNFRVAKKVSLFLKKGLYSGFEVFGLLNILPANGHVKVGKFVPNFGLKMDDHTAFTRTYTGFSAESGRPELTGLEAGISPGPVSITAGLFNASDGFGGSGGSQKAVLGRLEGIFPVDGKVYLGAGADIFRYDVSDGSTHTLYGGFGVFGAGEFSLLGEADLLEVKQSSSTVTEVIIYAEADYVVTPGVHLKVAYDFYDPDKDQKTGANSRYSFGFEFFPIAGVEVRPMYRIMREEPTEVKNDEFHLLFHIYI